MGSNYEMEVNDMRDMGFTPTDFVAYLSAQSDGILRRI